MVASEKDAVELICILWHPYLICSIQTDAFTVSKKICIDTLTNAWEWTLL